MTPNEIIFLVMRAGIALLCLTGVLIVWRHAREGGRFARSQGRVLALSAGLLATAGLLTLNDLRAALSPGEQMATYAGAWLWLIFDAGVPLLMIRALGLIRQRDAALAALEAASVTDALTGLPNRRGFQASASVALAECQRRGEPAAVVMFDLDRFRA